MLPAAKRSRRSCRFCGATTKLSNEHWLPQWVHPLVDDGPPAPYVRTTEQKIEHVWDAPLGSATVRQVCKDCNGGWMSELEQRVKPVLTPMLKRQARTIGAGDQRVLATWAAKTMLAADLARPDPVAPDDIRTWVREHLAPPLGTVILVARYGGHRFPLYAAHGTKNIQIGVGDGRLQDWRTLMLSVSAGPVVLQMFGHGLANVVDFRPTNWKADFAHVLWPDPSAVTWPLPRALGDDGLRRFVNEV